MARRDSPSQMRSFWRRQSSFAVSILPGQSNIVSFQSLPFRSFSVSVSTRKPQPTNSEVIFSAQVHFHFRFQSHQHHQHHHDPPHTTNHQPPADNASNTPTKNDRQNQPPNERQPHSQRQRWKRNRDASFTNPRLPSSNHGLRARGSRRYSLLRADGQRWGRGRGRAHEPAHGPGGVCGTLTPTTSADGE